MDAVALIGDLIADSLRQDEQARLELWARAVSASSLADAVGPRLGHLADDAWYSLLKIPDNLLSMLDSPQGWSALAAYIAADLGVAHVSYSPTVH
jgi:hypothetical protein